MIKYKIKDNNIINKINKILRLFLKQHFDL